MRTRILLSLLTAGLCMLYARPSLAVSKEIIQIQQQLDTLQQAVQNMQKTLDTQTAVLRTLIEQANDNVNSMKATIVELQKTNAQNLASSNSHFDTMTSQVQALTEGLEETKARLAKLSDQLAQTQNILQTLNAPPVANPPNGAPGGAPASAPPPPDPDVLYKSALGDYTTGRYDLAIQEFQQYLQNFPDTDLASNAQFYIGDSYYNQQKFDLAIQQYNACLEKYPDGNKSAAAQLKKAYALIAIEKKAAGERELRSLIKRYPRSHEAALANQRLRQLAR